MKTGKKIGKNNFTKLTHTGISLIVLVITIIVIVILASAVILTISNNNPVKEANIARYNSDVANMQAIFTNVAAKVMAKNKATVYITPGQINTTISKESESIGEIIYVIDNAENINNTNGKIIFDKGTNTDNVYYTGRKLPIYAAGETKWYVDEEGNISLEVAGTQYGNGSTSSNFQLNDYGFYYNQPYTGDVPDIGVMTFIFRENKNIEVLLNGENVGNMNAEYSKKSIYCVDMNMIGTVNDDGTQVYIADLGATFVLEKEEKVLMYWGYGSEWIYTSTVWGYEFGGISKEVITYEDIIGSRIIMCDGVDRAEILIDSTNVSQNWNGFSVSEEEGYYIILDDSVALHVILSDQLNSDGSLTPKEIQIIAKTIYTEDGEGNIIDESSFLETLEQISLTEGAYFKIVK